VGDGDDKQLLTDQQSPQYLALGKALGKIGKSELLLDIASNDADAFYGPQGRAAIMNAMEVMSPADLVAFHGVDNGMLATLNSPNVPDATKTILMRFMKNTAIDNMTMSHSHMMATFVGSGASPAKRQIQDAVDSGSVSNAKYQFAPLTPEDHERVLGKVDPNDQGEIQRYMKGQFSKDFSDYSNRVLAEVKKLKDADPDANMDINKVASMNESDAEAACERARLLHLKYLQEVMDRAEFQRTPAEQMREFLAHAEPDTRERMKGVSPEEFMDMMGALSAPESTPVGKTSGVAELFRQWSSYKWAAIS
jgi:hypothetical protein